MLNATSGHLITTKKANLTMFDNLMAEVDSINHAFKWYGCFDAINYINDNIDEYRGTKVYKEHGLFMRLGMVMVAGKEGAQNV